MKFCAQCGEGEVTFGVPDGDTHERHMCGTCGYINYVNPKVITGCIPVWGKQVLLCRRAIEPRQGLWTLPAGFLELSETMPQGAQREALEEAYARVEIGDLYAIYSVPHISQVYALYRAKLLDRNVRAGPESLEVGLFAEEDIPWDEIAFPAMHKTLELFFEDRRGGHYRTHSGDIIRRPGDRFQPEFRIRSN